jgi:sulfane dehydrogenase subunit SoxC
MPSVRGLSRNNVNYPFANPEETMRRSRRPNELDPAAGNGLLDRRLFLTASAAAIGGAALSEKADATEPLLIEAWMKTPGSPFTAYGQPSKYADKIVRTLASVPGTTGTGTSRTPHHLLDGTITPNGLHFERHHAGVPDINPDGHRLLVHGLVKRPLVFTLEALMRYPMESRVAFIECAGNSSLLYQKDPAPVGVQPIHGLLSCAEWTGVRLATLLEEAGIEPGAQWLLAEGADASGMSRSVPLAKAMDDALIAIYQNGEPVRPSNGYPMRLLLPGYEGNMNVKWLRRLKLTEGPTMTKDETSKYTILLNDGKSLQFCFAQEAKSMITRPSPGLTMGAPGLYEISGLAWSGYGRIAKVEVSADGGASWAAAALQGPVMPMAVTRFRAPWRWDGSSAILQSRATDDSGYVQPSRSKLIADRGARGAYHFNGITSWSVERDGEVKHVYA